MLFAIESLGLMNHLTVDPATVSETTTESEVGSLIWESDF